jgi:hypothetical protein
MEYFLFYGIIPNYKMLKIQPPGGGDEFQDPGLPCLIGTCGARG